MIQLLRKFIRETLDEAKMSRREIDKFSGDPVKDRWDIFLRRIQSGDTFLYEREVKRSGSGVPTGPKVQIPITISAQNNSALIGALTQKSPAHYVAAFSAGVEAFDVNTGARVVLNSPYDLVKDADFGSMDPFAAEKIQVDSLKGYLQSLLPRKKKSGIKIFVGQRGIVRVDDIKHVMGTGGGRAPKEDISLLLKGKPVAHVSLKSASNPAQMRQWGGISDLYHGSPSVAQNKEIQDFVAAVSAHYSSVRSEEVYRSVSPGVGRSAVYGDSLHVDLVAISRNLSLVLNPTYGPGVFEFSGGTIFYNPALPDQEWEPVLFATPSSIRNDLGIPNARLGVFPLGFANSKGATLI